MTTNQSIKELYDKIFTVGFLIRNGYYDVQSKSAIITRMSAFNYGKSDGMLENIFNMNGFVNFLNCWTEYENLDEYVLEKRIATEPISFTIPKSENSRREYKMINVYSYLALISFVVKNKATFIEAFLNDTFSISKYFNQFNFSFERTAEFKKELLEGGRKILHTDLSNFYPTLYTHSIAWMIDGKEKSKKNQITGFPNELDKLIEKCQFNETHGIPTGNLTTRIIAELYMCHFDKELSSRMADTDAKYARYVDDIEFPFNTETDSDDFLKNFEYLCRKYGLNVNENKIEVTDFPRIDRMDKTTIFNFLDDINGEKSSYNWRTKIKDLIGLCISEEAKGNKGSLKSSFAIIINALKREHINSVCINRIFSARHEITNFNLFTFILDVSLKDSRLANYFIKFYEDLNQLGFSAECAENLVQTYFDKHSNAIIKALKNYKKNLYHQEMYQLLIYMVFFEVDFHENNLLGLMDPDIDDYSNILIFILLLRKDTSDDKHQKLIAKVNGMLSETSKFYDSNKMPRMSQKLWLFRYFFYFLVEKEIISKKDINLYCKKSGCAQTSKHQYQTELNWNYIKGIEGYSDSSKGINSFYDNLLKEQVELVSLGKNGDFKYIL